MASIGTVKVNIGASIKPLEKALGNAERTLRRSSRRLSEMGNNLSVGLSLPLALVGGQALKASANIGALEQALESSLGSAAAAAEEMKKLEEAAKLPGLGFEQAIRGSVKLQAVGFTADESRRALAAFGNAIALAGGSASDLDGVALALTQIASKGKVSAEEINQLAERVPQIRAAMQAAFQTTDTEQIQKLGIEAKDFVSKIITEFEDLPKVNESLKNTIENAGIAITKSLAKIGTDIDNTFDVQGKLKTFIEVIESLAQSFTELSPATKKAILLFGALLVSIGPIVKIIGLAKLAILQYNVAKLATLVLSAKLQTALLGLSSAFLKTAVGQKVLAAGQAVLNAVMAVNPIVLVVSTLAALAAGFVLAYKRSETFRGFIDALGKTAKRVFDGMVGHFRGLVRAFFAFKSGDFEGAKNALIDAFTFSGADAEKQGSGFASNFAKGFSDTIKTKITNISVPSTSQSTSAVAGNSTAGGTGELSGDTPFKKIAKEAKVMQMAVVESIETLDLIPNSLSSIDTSTEQLKSSVQVNMVNPLRDMVVAFEEIEAKSLVLGESFNPLAAQIQALEGILISNIENGISPTSTSIQELSEQLAGLRQEQEQLEGLSEATKAMESAFKSAANTSVRSFNDIGRAALSAAAKVVKAKLIEAVASYVASSFANYGIYGAILAAGAGAVVGGLMDLALNAINVPALAEGGLAFGPTLAVVGDNPGAKSNPEVIAPLDKLKSMMGENGGAAAMYGEFTIKGNDLVYILDKNKNYQARRRGY